MRDRFLRFMKGDTPLGDSQRQILLWLLDTMLGQGATVLQRMLEHGAEQRMVGPLGLPLRVVVRRYPGIDII